MCEIRTGRGLWQPLDPVPVFGDRPGLPPPYRRWTAGVVDVHEDFAWRFRRGTLVSAEQKVVVRHHPLVTALAARVTPPAYTRVPSQDLERLPGAVRGARPAACSNCAGRTNHPVTTARVVTAAGDTLDATGGFRGPGRPDSRRGYRCLPSRGRGPVGSEQPRPAAVRGDRQPPTKHRWSNSSCARRRRGAAPGGRPGCSRWRPGRFRSRRGPAPGADPVAAGGQGRGPLGTGAPSGPARTGAWRSWPVPSGDLALKARAWTRGRSALRRDSASSCERAIWTWCPVTSWRSWPRRSTTSAPSPRGPGRSRVLRLTLPSAADVLTCRPRPPRSTSRISRRCDAAAANWSRTWTG